MATVRKLPSGKWQGVVRRKGQAPALKSFTLRSDCDKWIRSVESAMDRGAYESPREELTPPAPVEVLLLGTLIDRYIAEVSVTKRSCRNDVQRMSFLKEHFGQVEAAALRSQHIWAAPATGVVSAPKPDDV